MRAALTVLLMTVVSLAAVATGACMRQGAAVVAPVEVTIENGDGGARSPLVVSAPPPLARDRCTARLRASTIKTKEGCTLDERISHGDGTLLYPCSGDGPVEAVFGEHRFQGRSSDGTLLLALTTEIDWEDSCHWETKQSLRGEWKADKGKRLKLSWSYTEAPVSGTGCFGSCKASAEIEVDDLSQ